MSEESPGVNSNGAGNTGLPGASPQGKTNVSKRSFRRWRRWFYRKNLLLVLLVALGLLAYRGGTLSVNDQVKVEFPSPGTTLIKVNGRPDKASYLLSASDLWANTGLILQPHQTVTITASGRANLAVHRLVESAVDDVYPLGGWVGPDGSSGGSAEIKDTDRKELKVMPEAADGFLLAYLHKQGESVPGKFNPLRQAPTVIGGSGKLTNDSNSPKTIWFVINDAVLDDSEIARRAYLEVHDDSDPSLHSRSNGYTNFDAKNPKSWTKMEHWKYVKERQYWNLWYDDNIGYYQIQLDFNEGDTNK